MTATTVKSTLITNMETLPLTTRPSRQNVFGALKVSAATVEAATTSLDEDNDRILMVPVPMSAKVLGIHILNDDLDSNGSPALAADIGLWHGQKTGTAPGTLIDDDCYATAITQLQGASTTMGTNYAFEQKDIANLDKQVWEDGGLSANPGGTAYIGISVSTGAATAAAGTITMIVHYLEQ